MRDMICYYSCIKYDRRILKYSQKQQQNNKIYEKLKKTFLVIKIRDSNYEIRRLF